MPCPMTPAAPSQPGPAAPDRAEADEKQQCSGTRSGPREAHSLGFPPPGQTRPSVPFKLHPLCIIPSCVPDRLLPRCVSVFFWNMGCSSRLVHDRARPRVSGPLLAAAVHGEVHRSALWGPREAGSWGKGCVSPFGGPGVGGREGQLSEEEVGGWSPNPSFPSSFALSPFWALCLLPSLFLVVYGRTPGPRIPGWVLFIQPPMSSPSLSPIIPPHAFQISPPVLGNRTPIQPGTDCLLLWASTE